MKIIQLQAILKVKLSLISKRRIRKEKWRREFPEFKNSVFLASARKLNIRIFRKKQPEDDLGRPAEGYGEGIPSNLILNH